MSNNFQHNLAMVAYFSNVTLFTFPESSQNYSLWEEPDNANLLALRY